MYILSIDQSTAGTKATIFDEKGRLLHRATEYHKQYYPKLGWVEHDAKEILKQTAKSVKRVLSESHIEKNKILAVSITNQRETTVMWDRKNGNPVYRAIVWQCQRGKEFCDRVKNQGIEKTIKSKTGLLVDPYFSASKIKWILNNINDVREEAQRGNVLFGTIDSWLIWNLTNGAVHATDVSNASRTMLYNIRKLEWDKEILEIFTVPFSILPEVRPSDGIFGYTNLFGIMEKEVPITGVMGDSNAALFGHGCFEELETKATYGTGTSVMLNLGNKLTVTESPIVTSIAWTADNKTVYALEGNIHCTGDTIRWLIDELQIINNPEETEELAKSIPDNEGVYFVPAFVGLGAPYWDNEARALISGMSRSANKAHIVRAALESIAYQVKDLFETMIEVPKDKPDCLKVDGGATENSFLMQFQADILGVPVFVSEIREISARGAALLSLLRTGVFSGLKEIKDVIGFEKKYEPSITEEMRNTYYQGWKRAVRKVFCE